MTPFIPHRPTAKQTAFLLLDDFTEGFYGGAAGGGKSDALLMAALQYVDVPGYAALLLRRSFSDLALPGALMDRAYGWLGPTAAKWDSQEHKWVFPSGAIIQFGYLDDSKSRYRYQSAEFQMVGFDELTQFTIDEYLFLLTRLRRLVASGVPIRARAASNPGGIGHEWVKGHFIPSVVRDPVTGHPTGEIVYPRSERGQLRPFIPARLHDNPHIDRVEYEATLSLVDPVLRAQMLDGDWNARPPGGKFKRSWFTILPSAPKIVKRLWFWDLASTEDTGKNDPDSTAGAHIGLTPQGQVVIIEIVTTKATAAGVEQFVESHVSRTDPEAPGVPVWIEEEPGSSGKSVVSTFQRRVLPGRAVRGWRPTGDKVTRADPLSALAERGSVMLVQGPWIADFLSEAEAFGSLDQIGRPAWSHDDRVDAVTGGYNRLTRGADASSQTYAEPAAQTPVIRKGGLVLRGTRYIDKE